MRRKLIAYAAVLAAFGLGACNEDSLVVSNPNAGETQRVLGTADDAEKLLGSYYKRWYSGLYGAQGDNPPGTFEGMANVMSLQNYSSLANNCQNNRYPFTGASNSNLPGNVCSGEQSRPYFFLSEVTRVGSNFLTNVAGGLNLGSTARENRDKSFAEFLRGVSLGYIALFYDSASVVAEGQAGDDAGKLVPHPVVMDSAYAALQRAIDLANAPATGSNGFPLPADWIPSPTTFSAAEFVKLIRSYRALFRANVARTPTERGAVNWDLVIADAQAGISADHYNITSTTTGPGGGWRRIYDGGSTWHQMPAFIIGMGDVSGSYAAWLKQPLGERGAGNVGFFMVTPDLRFPQGTTRAAQQADFKVQDCEVAGVLSCKRYFTNRPNGSDQYTGVSWGWSNYDFNRFHSWATKGDAGSPRNGPLLVFPKTVVDMLQAEGLIRKGQFSQAAALINLTRVKNGLPAITAFDATSPVPGGADCVPKVPQLPNATTVACGNMMEAMKWEKRMEESFIQYAAWFLDERGWGDLPEGTALFWAVPYQDLQARGYSIGSIYGAGLGAGNAPGSVAGKSDYGW
jgi:hypothetical protein